MTNKTQEIRTTNKVIAGRTVKVAEAFEVKKATAKNISKYRQTLEALKDR